MRLLNNHDSEAPVTPPGLFWILAVWLAGNLYSVNAGSLSALSVSLPGAWAVVAVDTVLSAITVVAAVCVLRVLRARLWAWFTLLILAAWNGGHILVVSQHMIEHADYDHGTIGPLVLNVMTTILGLTLLRQSVRTYVFSAMKDQ